MGCTGRVNIRLLVLLGTLFLLSVDQVVICGHSSLWSQVCGYNGSKDFHKNGSDIFCHVGCDHKMVLASTVDASNLQGMPAQSSLLGKGTFQRKLVGEGSHRHLVSELAYRIGSDIKADKHCEVVFVERLSSGVFVDPFELERLLKRNVFAHFAVLGDTNLELPSIHSQKSVVEVHLNVTNKVSANSAGDYQISLELPLHARYPPLGESPFSVVEINKPDIILRCEEDEDHGRGNCLQVVMVDDGKTEVDVIKWLIPCGQNSHTGFVSVVTAISALLSALLLVLASVKSSLNQ